MKVKSKIMIVLIFSILVLFLKKHNVLQIEKHYVNTMIILLIILLFSILLILTQYKLDKNYLKEEMQYQNLNVLKYLCSIFQLFYAPFWFYQKRRKSFRLFFFWLFLLYYYYLEHLKVIMTYYHLLIFISFLQPGIFYFLFYVVPWI